VLYKTVPGRARPVVALVACGITAAAGCTSTTPLDGDRAAQFLADHIPHWAGGEPSSVPSRQTPPQPLDIFAAPPARPVRPLDASEQKQLQSDLVALRNRTLDRAKTARAADPADLPMQSADHQKPAEQAAVSTPQTATRRRPDGPS
jgi:hypothetical protein